MICKKDSKYNSNNHWTDDKKPTDYHDKIKLSNTSKWIDMVRQSYIVLNLCLTQYEINWLKSAAIIGRQTGKFPKFYNDELEQLTIKYKLHFDKFFNNDVGYFVRTENVSLKYGMHGIGPYFNFKSIIESLVTSTIEHDPMKSIESKCLKLYLFDWLNIDPSMEFRVFVHNHKVTCISQQNLYERHKYFHSLTELEINNSIHSITNKITDYLSKLFELDHYVKSNIKSFTIDMAIIDDQPYLIEFNSFGSEYAAGSALFHWILDRDLLYGIGPIESIIMTNSNIHFRYVK